MELDNLLEEPCVHSNSLCSNNFFFQLAVDFLFCLVLIEVLKQVSAWLKDNER